MTIETRMSFPEEGGTECPLDENPLPSASSNWSSTSSEASSEDVHSVSLINKKYPNLSNKNKKVISNSQRSKLRSSNKNLPLQSLQFSKIEESSKETANVIITNTNEIDKNDKCTSTNNSASLGEEKEEDGAKKSNKIKLLGAEGTKEEAASRKSMRLRLRRGKTDNLEEIFGTKERPRYVEDLTSIDFNNEHHKIMFMDALGMSFSPKRAKMEFPQDMFHTLAPCDLQNNEKVLENKLEEKVCEDCDRVNADKTVVLLEKTLAKQKEHEFTRCLKTSSEIIVGNNEATITNRNNSINDDDDGWECWTQRLSAAYAVKSVETSPSKKEINESLIRLVRLGTEVKVVVHHGLS